jgi:hypothetical protein
MAYRPKRGRKSARGKFRSKLENDIFTHLKAIGLKFGYETEKVKFVQPEKHRTYTPDIVIEEGKRFVEIKGKLAYEDQCKHLWIKEQHPNIEIKFIFGTDVVIHKGRKGANGKYRHSDWCEQHGFEYFIGRNPPKEFFE